MRIIKVAPGMIKRISEELGYSRNTVAFALKGIGSEFSEKVKNSRQRAMELGGREIEIVEIKNWRNGYTAYNANERRRMPKVTKELDRRLLTIPWGDSRTEIM